MIQQTLELSPVEPVEACSWPVSPVWLIEIDSSVRHVETGEVFYPMDEISWTPSGSCRCAGDLISAVRLVVSTWGGGGGSSFHLLHPWSGFHGQFKPLRVQGACWCAVFLLDASDWTPPLNEQKWGKIGAAVNTCVLCLKVQNVPLCSCGGEKWANPELQRRQCRKNRAAEGENLHVFIQTAQIWTPVCSEHSSFLLIPSF